MDQNHSNPNQNIHLFLHHVCNCQNTIYPTNLMKIDQSNQTYSGDISYKVEDDNRRIYLQPGVNYSVIKNGFNNNNNDVGCNTFSSPRGIEFLQTARNVHKVRDIVNDRYWSNVPIEGRKFNENGSFGFLEMGTH